MRCFDSVDGRKSLKVDSSKLFRLCGSFAFTIKKTLPSQFSLFFVILVSKYVYHVARQLQFSKAVSSLFLLLSKKNKKKRKRLTIEVVKNLVHVLVVLQVEPHIRICILKRIDGRIVMPFRPASAGGFSFSFLSSQSCVRQLFIFVCGYRFSVC